MHIVTNRECRGSKNGFDKITLNPNSRGPAEIRFLEVQQKGRGWSVLLRDDVLVPSLVKGLAKKYHLPLDLSAQYYASLEVACEVAETATKENRNILLYIPAMRSVKGAIEHAAFLEKTYGVIVVTYLYPENSGGAVGSRSPLTDFQDMIISTTALARVLRLTQFYRTLLMEATKGDLYQRAQQKFPDDRVEMDEHYAVLLAKSCTSKINLLTHGTGAYILQQVMQESLYDDVLGGFDNVILSSPDVRSRGHEEWIDRIQCRGRVYIAVNENDEVLANSREKTKTERLGEDTTFMASQRAVYVNFSGEKWVSKTHDLLKTPVQRNPSIKEFFSRALNGGRAELGVEFNPSGSGGSNFSYTTLHGVDLTRVRKVKRLAECRTCFFGFTYAESNNLFLMEELRNLLSISEYGIELIAPISSRTDVDVLKDIDNQLHAAHFGIVDLSDRSANVYIETGVLIGLGKPVIVIRNTAKEAPLPFNIGSQFTVDYTVDSSGEKPVFVGLAEGIRNGVDAILHSHASLRRARKWKDED